MNRTNMTLANTILTNLQPPHTASHLALRAKQPKLSIVGAGPGDPELITLKALRVLRAADVVLYDALANAELLAHCKPDAVAVYVGKRKGTPSIAQNELNELIVRHARIYGHVVRLKGGDPFVFGRGFEEMLYAEERGIPSEYIPGVSSAIGVAGLDDIPLTHRGTSESFWVITGNTAESEYSQDLYAAAQTNTTVVILMGLAALPAIAEVFKQYGKSHLPVAIIENGSLPHSRIVTGTIEDIVHLAGKANVRPPAMIVVGEVVNLRTVLQSHKAFHHYSQNPQAEEAVC